MPRRNAHASTQRVIPTRWWRRSVTSGDCSTVTRLNARALHQAGAGQTGWTDRGIAMSSTTPPSDLSEARRISRDALREAERLSGSQVVVVESPDLPTLSAIRFARGSTPAHVIEYRSDYA